MDDYEALVGLAYSTGQEASYPGYARVQCTFRRVCPTKILSQQAVVFPNLPIGPINWHFVMFDLRGQQLLRDTSPITDSFTRGTVGGDSLILKKEDCGVESDEGLINLFTAALGSAARVVELEDTLRHNPLRRNGRHLSL